MVVCCTVPSGHRKRYCLASLRPKELAAAVAVTNYSFCLGRSQTFLISYQRSSATPRSCPHPPLPLFSSYFDTRTHYVHLRDSFCLVGNLQRFFRSPLPPTAKNGGGGGGVGIRSGWSARIVMDIRLTRPSKRKKSTSDRVEDLYARARDVKDVRSSFYIIHRI